MYCPCDSAVARRLLVAAQAKEATRDLPASGSLVAPVCALFASVVDTNILTLDVS